MINTSVPITTLLAMSPITIISALGAKMIYNNGNVQVQFQPSGTIFFIQ